VRSSRVCMRACVNAAHSHVLVSLEYGSRTLEAVRSGSRESFRFSRTWAARGDSSSSSSLTSPFYPFSFSWIAPPFSSIVFPSSSSSSSSSTYVLGKSHALGLLHGFWHLLVTARRTRATLRRTRGLIHATPRTPGFLRQSSRVDEGRWRWWTWLL